MGISKSFLIQTRANRGITPTESEVDQLDAFGLANLAIQKNIKLRRKDRDKIPVGMLAQVVVSGVTELEPDEFARFPYGIQVILCQAIMRSHPHN